MPLTHCPARQHGRTELEQGISEWSRFWHARCQHGREVAVLRAGRPSLYLGSHAAEDVVQEVAESLVREVRRGVLDGRRASDVWARGNWRLYDRAIDWLRKTVEPTDDIVRLPRVAIDVEATVAERYALRGALSNCTRAERELLGLRVAGFEHAEIADIQRITVVAARQRSSRAMSKLRELIAA